MNNERISESLCAIQSQIEKFDNKANSLITIVGIVFALSLGLLEVFSQFNNVDLIGWIKIKYILLIIFSVFYFIAFAVDMIFLISVIYPRKKKQGKESLTYYIDIANMTNEQIQQKIETEEEIAQVDQLRINSIICAKKHKNLVIAIWLLIPVFLFMVLAFFVAIF